MEDFLYAYNQPKQFGKYDLFLDGKITANEIVYKVLTEDNDIENINLADKVKELESRLQTHFTFETVTELPTEGKETVIYLVANDEESGDKDSYNEYMWVKGKGFELIGSGTYAQQQADLQAEIDRASAAEKVLTDDLAQEVTDRTDADTILDEKITAEKERAIKAENELSTYIKKEEEIRTSQINGLNQEAKQNRNRIIDLESKVSTEITRATEAENELSARIKTIENYDINTRVNEIEVEVSRAKEAEEALQSQITTLESTIDSLQKAVVALELPNYSINKSSTFTDTEGDNQSYTVLLDMAKGSLIKGNNTTEVKINDETIGDFIFNIDDLGTITSN